MMAKNHFQEQIEAYDRWKQGLIDTIDDFREWLEDNNPEGGVEALQIYEAVEALKKDRLNIAFVAEFSRGKTELINAIFFADYQRRLLPSEAGRTTMCPTELLYDHEADAAYIKLLPIETRKQDTSIAEYKHDPVYWTRIDLDINDPDQMENALAEVIRTREVSVEAARELGLYDENLFQHLIEQGKKPETVEIPVWRHAIISFPHHLLKQGLVILDTPGLNALGHEPELTMSMLPSAHAVLFVLGADTGVTKSDLDVWQYHIEGFRKARQQKGIAVVLNKIDTMWDELKDQKTVEANIDAQARETADLLGIDRSEVFPVSAQKGLVARIRDDDVLMEKSRLGTLEQYLSEEILPARETILRDHIAGELGGMLDSSRQVMTTRLAAINKQLSELRSLSGKNADVILHLMKKTREEQTTYSKNVESFQSSRRLLQKQAANMLQVLSMNAIDQLINQSRQKMVGSWTTNGLKRSMASLFEGIREAMERVVEQAVQARQLVQAIYRKFHKEHGLPSIDPRPYSMTNHNMQIEMLYQEAEAFRKNPVTTMTEQNFVIKKFFINLVSQARNVFFQANQETEAWLKEVMNPLVAQINEHKKQMEKRLKTLRKINESRDTLDARIHELEEEQVQLEKELEILNRLYSRLREPLPVEHANPAA